MKRVANILTIVVAALVFLFFYQNISSAHYNLINNFSSSFAGATGKHVVAVDYELFDAAGDSVFPELVGFIKSNKCDALCFAETRRYDFIIDKLVYLYTEQTLNKLDFFKSVQGKNIDFTLNDGSYYSSSLNDGGAADTIDFINSSYQKDYQPSITVKQFQSLASDGYRGSSIYVFFFTEDSTRLIKAIEESEIASHLISEPNTNWDSFSPEAPDASAINMLLVLSISALIVITVCDIIGDKKEVTVRKLFGEKNTDIYLGLVAKKHLFNWVTFLAAQVLLYIFTIGAIRPIHCLLLRPLAMAFGLFTAFWIAANLVNYFILTRVGRAINLKRDSAVGFANIVTLALKVILIVLMITPFINLFSEAPSALEEYIILKRNRANMLNNFAIEGIDWEIAGNSAKLAMAYSRFEQLGWVYHDFSANYLPQEILETIPAEQYKQMFIQHPYIVANLNYLKDYDVRGLDGNPVDFDSLEHNTLLVPEAYKDDVLTGVYYKGPKGNTVYIQNGGVYYNYYPLQPDIEMLRQDNPIILFAKNLDSSMKWEAKTLSIRNEGDAQKTLEEFLTANQLDYAITMASMDSVYNTVVARNNSRVLNLAITLCLYVLMVFIFQFQAVFVYFSENKDKIAINYLFGKTYFQRYGFLILNSSLAYIAPLLVGTAVLKIDHQFMLLYVLFGVGFEFIISTLMIRSFEKKKTLSVLKGE